MIKNILNIGNIYEVVKPLLDSVPEYIIVLNKDFKILFASKEASMMLLGQENLGKVHGVDFVKFIDLEYKNILKKNLEEALKGTKHSGILVHMSSSFGKSFYAEISMGPVNENGIVEKIICVIKDVTDKRKSESISKRLYSELKDKISQIEEQNKTLEDTKLAILNILEDETELRKDLEMQEKVIEEKVVQRTKELQSEKSKLSASIDALLKAFIMVDLNKNIIQTNKNIESVLGKFDGDVSFDAINKKLKDSFNFIESYKDCINSKERKNYDNIAFGAKILEVRVSPVFSGEEKKEIIGVLFIIGDVTDEKVLERSKDEFFSIASHELRTPLTAIRGNASLIKQYYANSIKDQDMKDMIDDIEESSVRLIGIVNDFLNLSRLEQNRIEFKKTNFDLYEICKKALEEVGATKGNKDIKIVISKPKQKTICYADSERVMQIVVNLIGNSFKFTEKGSIKITFKVTKDSVTTYVSDTGRGISTENQKLLFRKFQQASDNLFTRDTTKGTGLGLYISKLMIEGMKGSIWLEKSEVNKGSVFAFSLPTS